MGNTRKVNQATITYTASNGKAYTLYMETASVTSPQTNSLSKNQLLKTGNAEETTLTGTANISSIIYNNLQTSFKDTWNNSITGSAVVQYSVNDANGVFTEKKTFNKAVVKDMNQISSIQPDQVVDCQISFSLNEEEGINDYFKEITG